MAIIAAMKKVLSPSSEKMIIISDEKKASEETHTHTHTQTHQHHIRKIHAGILYFQYSHPKLGDYHEYGRLDYTSI
jgi:hypothetical protein